MKVRFLGGLDNGQPSGRNLNGGPFSVTAKNPAIDIARHAVSIDERRAFYRQNLFVEASPGQDIEQVWFAGVHSDVGGSYPETESGLSKLALQWMLCEGEPAGLLVDLQRKAEILGSKLHYVAPDPTGPLHKSLHGFWWLAEMWPKVVRIHQPGPGNIWKNSVRVNLARPRSIPAGSLVHTSVEQ